MLLASFFVKIFSGVLGFYIVILPAAYLIVTGFVYFFGLTGPNRSVYFDFYSSNSKNLLAS